MAESKTKTTSTRGSGKAAAERYKEAEAARRKRQRQIYSVVLFALGVLLIAFSLLGEVNPEKMTAWDAIHNFLRGMFGLSVYVTGPFVIYAAIMISRDERKTAVIVKSVQLAAIILLISGAVQIIGVGEVGSVKEVYETGVNAGREGVFTFPKGGGVMGMILAYPLLFFGRVGASIIIVLIAFVFIMLMGNITLTSFLAFAAKPFKKAGAYAREQRELFREDAALTEKQQERGEAVHRGRKTQMRTAPPPVKLAREIEEDVNFEGIMAVADSAAGNYASPAVKEQALGEFEDGEDDDMPFDMPKPLFFPETIETTETDENNRIDTAPENDIEAMFDQSLEEMEQFSFDGGNAVIDAIENMKEEEQFEKHERERNALSFTSGSKKEKIEAVLDITDIGALTEQYTLPPAVLLDEIVQKRSEADITAELEANSVKLVETLKSFGVHTKIVGVVRGPSVTRYEIQPAPGVKISKITSLTDDIALNLAAAGVRMEAPIPGKSAVGVEVPNKAVDTVPIRELIDSGDFRGTDSDLGAVLGKSISGEIIIADIAKMPHLLIAGTTGSGKSVCVNSIIMSILFRATPEAVRFIMVDPKSVEFMIYSSIPHLLTPVVTDPKKAAGALKWAVNEMTRRYALFAENNVRDISGYRHAMKSNPELLPMPKIVIFIDELADLMMTAAREVEESICRLAQMARAAGMHLVIATQRPTVNVVTGLIKANIPSRIALKVASQVDSRTIIDSAGADKLLGKGDMLYAPVGMPKPTRVQGCWVSDKEVERVVGFIKKSFTLEYDENVIEDIERLAEQADTGEKDSGESLDSGNMDDDKLEDAIEAVIDAGQASTSYLQRKLSVGYGRAAKLMDMMEKMGVIGPFEGSKPRQILMSKQDWFERKMTIDK